MSGRTSTAYVIAHRKVRTTRGAAATHACSACGGPAQQWAFIHDAPGELVDCNGLSYSLDPNDYTPMCRRCHRSYDEKPITHCPKGHEYTPIIRRGGSRRRDYRACRECVNSRNRRYRAAHPLSAEQKATRVQRQRELRAMRRAERAS